MLLDRPVIGWWCLNRYLIVWERHLASISLKPIWESLGNSITDFKRTGTFQTITNSKWDTDNDDVFDEGNSRRSQRSQSSRKTENYPTIRTYQRPVKVLPSIPPQMTSTMTHHYDSSHDKLTSTINQRLLSSREFIEDYSTINPHQSESQCQLNTRQNDHFRSILVHFRSTSGHVHVCILIKSFQI